MNCTNKCEIAGLKVVQGEEQGPLKAHSNPSSVTASRAQGFPGKARKNWYTRAEPHASPPVPINPYHAVMCLFSSSVFSKILNSVCIFKEPDCKLFSHSTSSKTSDTEGLSTAQIRVTIGLTLPLGPIPHVRGTLLACVSSGPTAKLLIRVTLLPGGGWLLKNGSHSWWDFKCC